MKSQKQRDREQDLILLGYNQAMLDFATFPILDHNNDVSLTRRHVEHVVERLREKIGK